MHLTLKKEATKPAAANVLQQQARFDAFLDRYNQERPHQALGMKVPADLYTCSPRVYRGLEELSYPFHDATVMVTNCGRICVRLAPRAGLEPATLRLTAGTDGGSRTLWPVASLCRIARVPRQNGVDFIFALCRLLLPLAGVCGNQRARKGQRADCSLLRVRALRRPSALPTIQSCRSRLGTTPLAAEQCAEADETDLRVRLSLTVGDFRDPQSGSGPRSLGLQCVESGEVGSQRRTNRRSCGSFRVRCGKHAGQPDDIRTYRAIGFVLQNDRIMIRHASLPCPI